MQDHLSHGSTIEKMSEIYPNRAVAILEQNSEQREAYAGPERLTFFQPGDIVMRSQNLPARGI